MTSARARLALTAGRAAGWASRVTGRGAGTQVSGRVMLGIDPELLSEVVGSRRVALVSATNGKTTTTRLLAEALLAAGTTVATNHTGANMPAGIAAALGRDRDSDVAIIEVDERWLPKVVDPLGAELLVLGNLTRDQLDRFGEVRAIAEKWREVTSTHPDLRVVANASDPHVVWAAEPAQPTWIALGAPWRSDAATCPRCAALLDWSEDRFECPSCGFAQPETANRIDGDVLVLDGERIPLQLGLPGTWNRMNAALAIAAAVTHFEVPIGRAVGGIAGVEVVSGRFSTRRLPDGRDVRVILAKNPAGWTEVLRWLSGSDSGVVLAVNAHVADGRDPSWLWDVPYELLRGVPVAASGERALDVAVRLDYGGVDHFIEEDPLVAAAALPGNEVQIIASYTQFTHLTPGVVVSTDSTVRVGLVYPELLGTYGDRGNAIVLVERCRRRGIDAELVEVAAGSPIPDSLDVYLFGGGEDDPQVMASAGMRASRPAIDRARGSGAVIFAVCAGFQLIGHRYEARDGEHLDGLGLVDLTTSAGPSRLIGEVVVEPDAALGLPTLSGFENHGGRTTLGPGERALGRVIVGGGNGVDGADGVLADRLVGTYLHGPVLPRNAALADLLLGWVIGADALTPLDDAVQDQLRTTRLEAATATGWRARLGELRLNRG